MVELELSNREFRRLLDLVYIGNWIMNSARGEDRIEEYDDLESKIFLKCAETGAKGLYELDHGVIVPSKAFREGGIHEAIMDYEDTVFYEILAEELARRDLGEEPVTPEGWTELSERVEEYIAEFEEHGVENITLQD
ncbi:MAG: hypothetical protein ACSW8F_05005 [bacterium]